MIQSVNPTTGAILATFDCQASADIEQAVAAAHAAQRSWARRSVRERAEIVGRAGAILREQADDHARLITLEMGKPISEARGEIEKCAATCVFYAEHAETFLRPDPVVSNATESFVAYDPLGVILAIMPWNFPFWQVVRFAAPTLAVGNAVLLKHANNVPQCAKAIERVFTSAGVPPGIFTSLLAETDIVEGLLADRRVAAVTLTGSTRVGRIVAAQAGRHLKKQVLELGGSDPFIVLRDADVAAAAKAAAKARNINAGQSCVSAKRFIVEDQIADRFAELFCQEVQALSVGDPMQADTQIGPMARDDLRTTLTDQVGRTLSAGAVLRTGGRAVDGPGFFFQPTVLDRVTAEMPAFAEEMFGPVASVIRARDADEAIELANATEFGLGASIWTDAERGRAFARHIEAGAVFVNGMVASDPRLPFGGIKQSGYGRELGVHGMREFTNVKTVWIGPVRSS